MKTVKEKKQREWYYQLGVSQPNYKRLEKLKAAKEGELGGRLSWNSFISMMISDAEGKKVRR